MSEEVGDGATIILKLCYNKLEMWCYNNVDNMI